MVRRESFNSRTAAQSESAPVYCKIKGAIGVRLQGAEGARLSIGGVLLPLSRPSLRLNRLPAGLRSMYSRRLFGSRR